MKIDETSEQAHTSPKWTRMLTGDRPTGALHLGHYVGSLKMRVELQEQIDCFVLIADLHVLTTRTHDLHEIGGYIRECVLDYLAVGIDPQKTTIYLQSLVPEVLPPFHAFWAAAWTGKLLDDVVPTTYAFPAASTAIPVP